VIGIKVGASDGTADVTQVIAAVSWVTQHAKDPGLNIRVLNLSYGTGSTQDYRSDPLAYAVETAWRKGIVVVAAGGNDGSAGAGRRGGHRVPHLPRRHPVHPRQRDVAGQRGRLGRHCAAARRAPDPHPRPGQVGPHVDRVGEGDEGRHELVRRHLQRQRLVGGGLGHERRLDRPHLGRQLVDRAAPGQRGLGRPALGGQHVDRQCLERRALGQRPLELTPPASGPVPSVTRPVPGRSYVEPWTVLLRR
jgi:subtilisin family serine protease